MNVFVLISFTADRNAILLGVYADRSAADLERKRLEDIVSNLHRNARGWFAMYDLDRTLTDASPEYKSFLVKQRLLLADLPAALREPRDEEILRCYVYSCECLSVEEVPLFSEP